MDVRAFTSALALSLFVATGCSSSTHNSGQGSASMASSTTPASTLKTTPVGTSSLPTATGTTTTGTTGTTTGLPGTLPAPFLPPAPMVPTVNLPTVRVAAGNKQGYTDSSGNIWAPSTGFTGGNEGQTSDDISGTADPGLYQHEMNGDMTFTASVPDGTYDVTLKLAEFYWSGAGKRVFNVALGGVYVLGQEDIYAEAGKDAAVDYTFTTTVVNGQLVLQFENVQDNAKVSAIQIAPSASQVPALPTILVCGGFNAGYADSVGQFWGPSSFAIQGGNGAKTGTTIQGTADSPLYQHELAGDMTYTANLPNGNYNVTLKFAEFYWSAAGKRVFDVNVNGAQVLTSYDIFADAGGKDVAVDHTYPITVTNGQVAIQFVSRQDHAKFAGIQIAPR